MLGSKNCAYIINGLLEKTVTIKDQIIIPVLLCQFALGIDQTSLAFLCCLGMAGFQSLRQLFLRTRMQENKYCLRKQTSYRRSSLHIDLQQNIATSLQILSNGLPGLTVPIPMYQGMF